MYYQEERLSEERIELLNQIGMRFEANKNELAWQTNYKLAQEYYKHHGDLKIYRNFKTKNGYEYDENGFALGRWISRNRMYYQEERLSEERIELLNQIGMYWGIKENAKEQIKIICEINNINFDINRKVLNHISIQELVSKINFLNEKNTLITNNQGILHEIFFISNADLSLKYGITLEELIYKYYVKTEEKKVK